MPSTSTVRSPTQHLDWDAIKDRIDLEIVAVALLGEPPGRKGGGRLWWSCPFHDDSNPSFVVDPERGRWRCHGCRLHGDAVDLAMKFERSTFPDAVRRVVELCGLTPSERDRPPTKDRKSIDTLAKRPSGLPLAEALALVEAAVKRLRSPEGVKALA